MSQTTVVGNPDDPIASMGQLASSVLYNVARWDCATFCELILRDEETGLPIELQPFQEEWHEVLDREKNAVIWAFVDSGKTQQISIAQLLWKLGRDPRKRFAILAATQSAAVKIIRTMKGHIEDNAVLHQIFPGLRRGKVWTDNAFEVMRPYGIKDPSVQAYSPEGGKIQGARLDGLVIDDVLTENNTLTAHQRKKISSWIKASAFSRLSKKAFIVFLTNAWHPEDMAHELNKQGWWAKKYPVLVGGRSAWPDHWPMDRIDEARTVRLGALEFARQMMCEPRDDSTSRFRQEWVNRCLENGEGYRAYKSFEDIHETDPDLAQQMDVNDAILRLGGMPEGYATITGVDLAISQKSSADLTALFTLLLWPDGTRQVLEVQAGRWPGPEIIDRIVSVHERYRSVVVVENNGAQQFLLQWTKTRAPGLRVRAHTTGRNKLSPEFGIESLAAELESGMWLIPSVDGRRTSREIEEWIYEMISYDPKAHTGDRLIASWIADTYARAIHARNMKQRERAAKGTTMGNDPVDGKPRALKKGGAIVFK